MAESPAGSSPKSRAALELQLIRSRIEELERARSESIAIVGIGCRFPGGATGPKGFWQVLASGTDAISEVPPSRWDVNALFDPDPDAPGKTYARWGGFIEQADCFDAAFFGVSPREAAAMDPQQRLLLEVCWEALEHAGQPPDRLTGTPVGVFVGISTNDYQRVHDQQGGLERINAYSATGVNLSVAAGRISYTLGLQGPALAVDTACSSSLVALHLACQSLRAGECRLALAAGVNLILAPEYTIAFSRARMLALDGRCKTFDAAADGYVRGEGCGVLVLQRLSEARTEGRNILAVVRGTAVNQDGPSSSLTAPNGPAQQAVIRAALASAKLAPEQVSYVETHGTGTPLGDPIELQALAAVFGGARSPERRLAVGSVKTNIGHLEAAAGMAGVIKVVLAMRSGLLPPHLHLHELNPHLDPDTLPLVIPTASTVWQPVSGCRRAGVSAFGFSGTNAHAVLEEAPASPPVAPSEARPQLLLPLSARHPDALRDLANRYARHLGEHPEQQLADICFTAGAGRSHLDHRIVALGGSAAQLREALRAYGDGRTSSGLISSTPRGAKPPVIGFLFTGQASQYSGMGRQLYQAEPTFRDALDGCARLLQHELEVPLLDVLFDDRHAQLLDETAYTQPALFALEHSLAALWRSWGIEPSLVLGHSVGEYVAACVAGVFTLEDGLRLIARRARLMHALPAGGAMAAVFAEHEMIRTALEPHRAQVAIAAVNGPRSLVISGAGPAVDSVLMRLTEQGVRSQRLRVSHAFHSPALDPMLDELERAADAIELKRPRIDLISNLTAARVSEELCTGRYWRRHARETVQFWDGLEMMRSSGCDLLVEIGPDPVLLGIARQGLREEVSEGLPSLRRGRSDLDQMMESLARLYCAGAKVDWRSFHRPPRRLVELPTYPFRRQRYWLEGERRRSATDELDHASHPLLGRGFETEGLHVFERAWSSSSPAWVGDHRVHGLAVLPAAAQMAMALAAVETRFPGPKELEAVTLREALLIGDGEERRVQVVVREEPDGTSFKILSRAGADPNAAWVTHSTGNIRPGGLPDEQWDLRACRARCAERIDVAEQFARLRQGGISYGSQFQGLEELWKGNREAIGLVQLGGSLEGTDGPLNPVLLDAALQVVFAALPADAWPVRSGDPLIPVDIQRLRFFASPATRRLWSHGRLRPQDEKSTMLLGDVTLSDGDRVVAEIAGVRLQPASREALLRRHLGEDARESKRPVDGRPARRGRSVLSAQLQSLPASERREHLMAQATSLVATVIGTKVADLDARRPFRDLGLDSLMAVELRSSLAQNLGLSLPVSLAFDYPNLDALVSFLDEELTGASLGNVDQSRPVATDEPVAIIGMGCRFPGAPSPAAFWQLLKEGASSIREVPADRWDIDALYDPDPDAPGKMCTRWGGFIDGVDGFDPLFFGISPREAEETDPQQRLLLEVCWEALENAAQSPQSLAGTEVGVFLGISTGDYYELQRSKGGLQTINSFTNTSRAFSVAAGRISYALGLQGPSMAVDTACSSSLVTLHLACQSLRLGECRLALSGGVNLMLSPEVTIGFSKLHAMSPEGRCKTFDERADGYVRGEGCGVLVLKRLSDAVADGDDVLALIRGTAINQDGASSGLTAPNGPAQQAVIRAALARAGVEARRVSYVEAHGTGTPLGDPIEAQSLAAVFAKGRSTHERLAVGSVKTNIGHLEAAAGVAGTIKVVLALLHEWLPAHLNLGRINPHIGLQAMPLVFPTNGVPWPRGERPRVAGVSSFAFQGTNAHVVLEEAPIPGVSPTGDRAHSILTLSAKSRPALIEQARRFEAHLAAHSERSWADTCFSANVGRSHFNHRLALVAATAREASQQLRSFSAGEDAPGLLVAQSSRPPRVGFLFTGQGAQYEGMGSVLYQTQGAFRDVLERCAELLTPHLGCSLLDVLFGKRPGLLDRTEYTQPALFAFEYALARLWQSWGVEPDRLLGHSVGELAAACVAGLFSLEDGLRLVAERGRLMGALPAGGVMAAVYCDEATLEAAVAPHAARVSVAAFNGPQVVISGEAAPVDAILRELEAAGIRTVPLQVSHAFHSVLMDPVLDEFRKVAGSVRYSPPRKRLISGITGELASEALCDPEYWTKQLREPVRFAAGMAALLQSGCDVLVEIGPSPVLLGLGRQCSTEGSVSWVPSLRSGCDDLQQMLRAAGELHVHGAELDWQGLSAELLCRRVALPTYPFQRQRCWFDQAGVEARPAGRHRLLGRRLLRGAAHVFEVALSSQQPGFLGDHRIKGVVVLPGAAYVEMALAAARDALASDRNPAPIVLTGVRVGRPLTLSRTVPRTVQLVLTVDRRGPQHDRGPTQATFEVLSESRHGDRQTWVSHAGGQIMVDPGVEQPTPENEPIASIRSRCTETSPAELYSRLSACGLDYGPSFRRVIELWRGSGEALGLVSLPADADDPGDYLLHPILLDACFHLLAAAVPDWPGSSVYVPVRIDKLRLAARPGRRLWGHAVMRESSDAIRADLRLISDDEETVAVIKGLELRPASLELTSSPADGEAPAGLYELEWQRRPRSVVSGKASGTWLILADGGGVGHSLAAALESRGARTVLCSAPGPADPGGPVVDPTDATKLGELVRETATGHRLRGVVHLWSLDLLPAETLDAEALLGSQLHTCGSVLHLLQAPLGAAGADPPRLFLITRAAQKVSAEPTAVSPAHASLWGLGRVVALEHPELHCTLVDLDPTGSNDDTLVNELLGEDGEDEVAIRGEERYVPRLRPLGAARPTDISSSPVELELEKPGVLDSIRLRPTVRRSPPPGMVEIRVTEAGLNFRDVVMALGIYPGATTPMGGECAGEVAALGEGVVGLQVGDQVMAIATGSFQSFVLAPSSLVVKKPAGLSTAEAATIPIAFLTAEIALRRIGKMAAGDRVLIHAATGGVGLAALQLARRSGAEVFATAGSPRKRALLTRLGVRHVLDSRTLDFARQVLEQTDSQGVDILLNSFTGEFIPKGLSILRPGGRFIEIGKIGIWDERRVAEFRPDVSYAVLALDQLVQTEPESIGSHLRALAGELERGELRPLPVRVFAAGEAVTAFRCLQQAKQVGKLALQMTRSPGALAIRQDGTYLITGGLGGLGLEVARWIVDRGGRSLVLVGRSAAHPSASASATIAALEAAGARVRVTACDVSREDEVRGLVASSRDLPPLRGVVHAAGTLADGILDEQSWDRFAEVLLPKMAGAWNLHLATRGDSLDFFLLFSSAASLLGSRGQGSYAAANAFLDALAHYRRGCGLPAVSINWGPWDNLGMTAEGGRHGAVRWQAQGIEPIARQHGLAVLDWCLGSIAAEVGVLPIRWEHFLAGLPRVPGRLSALEPARPLRSREASGKNAAGSLREQLSRARPADRRQLLLDHVCESVASVISLGAGSIDPAQPLMDLGVDSLLAVELRNRLGSAVALDLPQTLVFNHPTASAIADYLAHELLPIDAVEPPASVTRAPEALRTEQSREPEPDDDQVWASLAAELEKTAK